MVSLGGVLVRLGRHPTEAKTKRTVGIVTVFTLIGLVFAGCGAASNSSQSSPVAEPVITTTSVTPVAASMATRERDFLAQWIPDIHAYRDLVRQVSYGSESTATQTYSSLQGLYDKWGLYEAPSPRTQSLLSQWLQDVQTLRDVARLIAEGNVEAAKTVYGTFIAKVTETQEFEETLGNLALELGVANLLGDLSTTSTIQSTTTTVQVALTTEATATTPERDSPVLDELSALAATVRIPIYYLGPSYGGAPLIEVSSRKDGYAVSLVYRNTDPEELLSINLVEYDLVQVPELKKPFDWWTLVSEVETGQYRDSIYLSESGYLFYVAWRDTVEINIAGYSAEKGH